MQATFTVLGIAPTRDTKAIRRAYAQRLKVLDQHTQADEFEALRAAYETAMRWAAHADAPGEPPGAAGPAPSPAATPGYALRQPPQVMRQAAPDATWRALRKRQKIIDQAIAELMRTGPRDLPAAWQRLNTHPALESLDASAELGDRLLDRIAQHPDGQHALYTLGQQHFHWEQASYRPRTPRAAQWLQRYIEERELWARQPAKQRLRHERAIERMRRHPSPTWRQARRAHATIHHVSRHMPAWWSLHVPAALHEQHARVLQSPPRWVRGIRRLRDMQSRWPVWLVWICVGVLAHGLYLWLTPATPPTAPQASA
ncbi:hypothetical protein GG851_22995, partial [Bordetella petrii]|nr:hypothetical protein [Bordetella petrii]